MKRADRLRSLIAQLDAIRAELEDLIAESDRLPRKRKRAQTQPTQEPTQEQIDAARRGLRRAGIAA